MVGLFILAVEIVATLTIVAIPVAYYILGRKRMFPILLSPHVPLTFLLLCPRH